MEGDSTPWEITNYFQAFYKKPQRQKKILQPYKIQFDNFYLKIRENIEIASEASYGYFKKKIREYFFWIFAPKIKQKLQ